ncbi:MAG: DUF4367 domain-containing protein, partial [Lachnospiraceae bacterium]|nr:DUF4367 domain-containing protein [Lachnospiraceae bacterium]
MRLEDLKQDFPQMPEELRTMIGREVQKQIRTGMTGKRRGHRLRKTLIVAFAAAMLFGTTVFAAIAYRMHNEPVGTYAVKTKMEQNENDSSNGEQTQEIPDVTMEVSYLPDGMVKTEEGKYSYTNAMYQGGVSIVFYKMDTGDAQFEMLTTNVKESERIDVGGYAGVYFALQSGESEDISFNQRIYVAYPDVHYVMELYAASDVSKEDALKIAEGIRLHPVSDDDTPNAVIACNWSDYVAASKEETVFDAAVCMPESVMVNTHAVGEAFAAMSANEVLPDKENVEIKVVDVQVCDTVSLLDLSVMDNDFREEVQKEISQSGQLLPTKINYIKYGDGINTIDTVVE